MERGSPSLSFVIITRRVSSPRAAKTGAVASVLAVMTLCAFRDMVFDVLHLLGPATIIHAEGFEAAVAWDFVETRFREQQQRAGGGLLQSEFDERGCFLRVVFFGIDSIGMPRQGK